jgi:hypothetical protein
VKIIGHRSGTAESQNRWQAMSVDGSVGAAQRPEVSKYAASTQAERCMGFKSPPVRASSSAAIRSLRSATPRCGWPPIVPNERAFAPVYLYGARVPGLEVADDTAWLDAFGVEPQTEEVSDDEYVRELRIPTDAAEELHITWDVTDGSVRVRHRRADSIVVDLYREQATLLGVERSGRITALVMEYGTADAVGRARIQVTPELVIEDKFLRT